MHPSRDHSSMDGRAASTLINAPLFSESVYFGRTTMTFAPMEAIHTFGAPKLCEFCFEEEKKRKNPPRRRRHVHDSKRPSRITVALGLKIHKMLSTNSHNEADHKTTKSFVVILCPRRTKRKGQIVSIKNLHQIYHKTLEGRSISDYLGKTEK